jgi:hypothetical protein
MPSGIRGLDGGQGAIEPAAEGGGGPAQVDDFRG